MSSERRIRTSRANGALSRGPVTPEGRARSALNALGHGFSANQVVLSSESEDDFNRIRDAFRAEFVPESPLDTDLVEQLAAARWRIRRSWGPETGLFELELLNQEKRIAEDFEFIEDHVRTAVAFRALADKSRSLALLDRYEARHRRTYERTLHLLFHRPAPPDRNDPPADPDPGPYPPASSDPVLPPRLLIASPADPASAADEAVRTEPGSLAPASEAKPTSMAYASASRGGLQPTIPETEPATPAPALESRREQSGPATCPNAPFRAPEPARAAGPIIRPFGEIKKAQNEPNPGNGHPPTSSAAPRGAGRNPCACSSLPAPDGAESCAGRRTSLGRDSDRAVPLDPRTAVLQPPPETVENSPAHGVRQVPALVARARSTAGVPCQTASQFLLPAQSRRDPVQMAAAPPGVRAAFLG